MDSTQGSRLLSLPSELQTRILEFALRSPCVQDQDDDNENILPVDWTDHTKSIVRRNPDAAWWGTRRMSAILAINRSLHDEAERILFSGFRLNFGQDTDPDDLQREFLGRISDPAKRLVRAIRVTAIINTSSARASLSAPAVMQWRRAFDLLTRSFANLQSVEMAVGFAGMEVDDPSWVQNMIDQIVFLAGTFHAINDVTLAPPPRKLKAQRREIWTKAQTRIQKQQ